MFNKFADYILEKDALDLNLIQPPERVGPLFKIRRGLNPFLFRLSLIFLLPCAFLLVQLCLHFGPALLISSLLICPVLITVGLILNCTWIEQTYDLDRRTWTQSLKFLKFSKQAAGHLPADGVIELQAIWSNSHSEGGGPYWKYRIQILPKSGFSYSVARNYDKALAFAQHLSALLNLPLKNTAGN